MKSEGVFNIMQRVEGFEAFQAKKALKDRQHWEKVKNRGHLLYLAQNIAMFIALLSLIELIQLMCIRVGWLRSTASTSLAFDLFTAVVAGVCFGQMEWSNMRRKFDTPPPGDGQTMS